MGIQDGNIEPTTSSDPVPIIGFPVIEPRKKRAKSISERDGEITEEMIDQEKSPTRFSFRNGLFLIIGDEGNRKTFHLRIRSAEGRGSSTKIGEYGQMTLSQAREKAREVKNQVATVRSEKALKTMLSEVKKEPVKPRRRRQSGITDIERFRDDLRRLDTSQFCQDDCPFWILLIALMPTAYPEAIAMAKWSHFSPGVVQSLGSPPDRGSPGANPLLPPDPLSVWLPQQLQSPAFLEIPSERNSRSRKAQPTEKKAYLSDAAMNFIRQRLWHRPRADDNDNVFPVLAAMDESDRRELLSKGLSAAFPNQRIDATDIGLLFEDHAKKESCFLPEFIESIAKHTRGKTDAQTAERKFLLDWWASVLLTPKPYSANF